VSDDNRTIDERLARRVAAGDLTVDEALTEHRGGSDGESGDAESGDAESGDAESGDPDSGDAGNDDAENRDADET
jgi:hypothetical protein